MKRTLLFLLSGVLSAGALSAQVSPLKREPNRLLFLVDRSFSMGRIDDETRQVVFDMIYDGLGMGDDWAAHLDWLNAHNLGLTTSQVANIKQWLEGI